MNNNPMTVKKFADALAITLIVLILFALFGITGLFSSIELGRSETIDKNDVFTKEYITELEIDVSTANVSIIKGDDLTIDSTKNSFRVANRNGRIILEEKNSLFSRDESRKATITIPEDFSFQKVEIESGSANINAQLLKADYLELDATSGDVSFDSLEVNKKAEIECKAGTFTIKSGTLSNLEFSLGVGTADICAKLLSNGRIETGVGELKLTLAGGKDAYTLHREKSLGIFTVDSKLDTREIIGEGENKIRIKSGVGALKVSFEN